jgi:hypothetical protein
MEQQSKPWDQRWQDDPAHYVTTPTGMTEGYVYGDNGEEEYYEFDADNTRQQIQYAYADGYRRGRRDQAGGVPVERLEEQIRQHRYTQKFLEERVATLERELQHERDERYAGADPVFVIAPTGGGQLGNCYYGHGWRVTSKTKLSDQDLRALNEMGVLGHGQEFYVRRREEQGDASWSAGPHYYYCESRVDSSD